MWVCCCRPKTCRCHRTTHTLTRTETNSLIYCAAEEFWSGSVRTEHHQHPRERLMPVPWHPFLCVYCLDGALATAHHVLKCSRLNLLIIRLLKSQIIRFSLTCLLHAYARTIPSPSATPSCLLVALLRHPFVLASSSIVTQWAIRTLISHWRENK